MSPWKKITTQPSRLIKNHPHLFARATMAINDGTHIASFTREAPNAELRGLSRTYNKSRQLPIDKSAEGEYVEVDPKMSMRIADAFDAGVHSPKDASVLRSYRAFADETLDQYKGLKDAGFQMIPWGDSGQPYARSSDFIKDVAKNKRLYFFKTINPDGEESFGDGSILDHPLLAKTGETVKDSAGRPHEMTYNDLFRAVHDLYGHVKEANPIGPRGEENAWRQHVRMFTPLAARAMTTETRGQNSWVNFGAHLRRPDGTIPSAQDADYVPLPNRPYSDQKVMLLPEEFSRLVVPGRRL